MSKNVLCRSEEAPKTSGSASQEVGLFALIGRPKTRHNHQPIGINSQRFSRLSAQITSPASRQLRNRIMYLGNKTSWRPTSNRHSVSLLMMVACSLVGVHCGYAFVTLNRAFSTSTRHRDIALKYSSDDSIYGDGVDNDMDYLNARLQQMQIEMWELEMQRPPNPDLTVKELVTEVLDGLRNADDPLPESGFRMLLRASTPKWRNWIYRSVGASADANEQDVASALGEAIGRPTNQFSILVGADDAEEYVITFPREPVDSDDGTCFLECRLRSKKDDALLVVMGWQLLERPSDGAWLVNRIDWQDFRDHFRVGPEELMRRTLARWNCL